MRKARGYILMVAAMLHCVTFGANSVWAETTKQVDVLVDTKLLRSAGEVIKGTTFVTLDTLRNDFRFHVYYEPQTKRISILSSKKEIVMKVEDNAYLVNGHKLFMEEAPRIKDSSILVPLRVICENMGFSISQDSVTKAVSTHFVSENDLQFENKELKINRNNTNVSYNIRN
ncbi:copper amine oxidase N-terminal domain-containing protein [Brevibacillus laterosporus]|uniref:copper amine oxidase N-terminal domain-containing protein n=1 Tax=Brevibacillus laterosporus TaxID=1465 RepID=UPI00036121DC|nr:copper amine oxidase N-terminal domain-containing protein [Brevibacillus laterosporus]MED2005789.1 copper amine oxidase N-terminal domain-containing protein [Brevibacillus laterosporus]MED4765609.1 copper amine oxidase N-terminal domain-containing protein [Brevibacillus laterosporus]